MEKCYMLVKCSGCKKKIKKNIDPELVNKNLTYRNSIYCEDCTEKRTRKERGRTLEQMDKIGVANRCPVKIFTRAEIKAIEHTIDPPPWEKPAPYIKID